MTRLLERYRSTIVPQLQTELKLSNRMAVPRIEKIVVNAGLGKPLVAQPKNLEAFTGAFRKIVGQQPLVTKARKAISAFRNMRANSTAPASLRWRSISSSGNLSGHVGTPGAAHTGVLVQSKRPVALM